MWAYRLSEPGVLQRVETPEPAIDGGQHRQVLVRTRAVGICGSDIARFRGTSTLSAVALPGPPGVPAHEIAGTVIASHDEVLPVGSEVVGWASGSNGLAEYVLTGADRLVTYDPALDPLTAVILQPLACVLHASDKVGIGGRHVAVVGLGPIGLLFAHVARSRGARRVTGVDPVDRSDVASVLGVDDLQKATAAEWARQLPAGDRPDICIEAVGHQTDILDDVMRATADQGTVLHFGIPDERYYQLDMERLMRGNLTLLGNVTRDHRQALDSAKTFLAENSDLGEALVSHIFGLRQTQEAFTTAAIARAGRHKVLIDVERDER
ncbi:zinc-binding dehydrogenase [Intrasporangium mesophilum]